jgi:hypothetical protein
MTPFGNECHCHQPLPAWQQLMRKYLGPICRLRGRAAGKLALPGLTCTAAPRPPLWRSCPCPERTLPARKHKIAGKGEQSQDAARLHGSSAGDELLAPGKGPASARERLALGKCKAAAGEVTNYSTVLLAPPRLLGFLQDYTHCESSPQGTKKSISSMNHGRGPAHGPCCWLRAPAGHLASSSLLGTVARPSSEAGRTVPYSCTTLCATLKLRLCPRGQD